MTFSPFMSMRIAVLVAVMAVGSGVAQAQPVAAAQPPASERAAPVRTGKERLGNKWSDERRLDNCKVPPDKRGTKPRPDTCATALTH
jgi:hypothetical protein